MGQFQDRGDSYRPVIFVNSDQQRIIAEASKEKLIASGRFNEPIVTQIEAAKPFYPAEEYHQDFYKKEPWRAELGEVKRKAFIRAKWSD